MGLTDLGYKGERWTWTNKWICVHNLKKRIYRIFVNRKWLYQFPFHPVKHLDIAFFSYKPRLLSHCTDFGRYQSEDRQFRFEPYWLTETEFVDIVAQSWSKSMLALGLWTIFLTVLIFLNIDISVDTLNCQK